MLSLLEDESIYTGFGAGNLNVINKIGQVFNSGFNVSNVAGTEAFEAFTNQIVLPLVQELGRNPTDLDLKFVVKSQASLATSVAGNRYLLKVAQIKNERDIRAGNFVNDFILQEIEKGTNTAKIPFLVNKALMDFVTTDEFFINTRDQLRKEFKIVTGQSPIDDGLENENDIDNDLKNKGLIK